MTPNDHASTLTHAMSLLSWSCKTFVFGAAGVGPGAGGRVVGATVVGIGVVGAGVVGIGVVGAAVVGIGVVGAAVVGIGVVGAAVVGIGVVGVQELHSGPLVLNVVPLMQRLWLGQQNSPFAQSLLLTHLSLQHRVLGGEAGDGAGGAGAGTGGAFAPLDSRQPWPQVTGQFVFTLLQ